MKTPPRQRGKLIVIEGARGSGKSTCLRTIAEHLRSDLGLRVVETHEPTHTTTPGALARRILRGEETLADPRSFQLLCAADRLEHVAVTIEPALARGDVVLCDRYVLSSAAYAPAEHATVWTAVEEMNRQAPQADLTIVLCVPLDVCAQRVRDRGDGPDALAATSAAPEWFYKENSEYAKAYAHSRAVVFVDGTHAPGHVATLVLERVLAEIDS